MAELIGGVKDIQISPADLPKGQTGLSDRQVSHRPNQRTLREISTLLVIDSPAFLFWINFSIGFISRQSAFFTGILKTMFHSQKTPVTFVINMLEDIFIVYLSGSGFFTARGIPYLKIS